MDLASHVAAGAAVTIMAHNLLIIEDIAVGYVVDAVARDLNVSVVPRSLLSVQRDIIIN
jgi:hypothetical protein